MFSGKALRAARHAAGLTLQQLGEVIGCKINDVWRYENGLRRPRPGRQAKLAEALGVTVKQLQDVAEAAPGETLVAAEQTLLAQTYGVMDAARRSAVTAFAVALQEGASMDQATVAAETAAKMAGGIPPGERESLSYWEGRRLQLRRLLEEADRRHGEALREEAPSEET